MSPPVSRGSGRPTTSARPVPSAGTSRLTGRERELSVVEQVLDGRSGCLTIVGEPGIGKTRLTEALRERVEAREGVVLRGGGAEFEGDVAFGVIVDALDRSVAALGNEPGRIGAATVAELARVFSALPGGHGPAPGLDAERFRLHHAVRAVLEHLAAERPVALVLDDLQWADAASLELVGHLVVRPPEGVVLVLVCRTGRLPARLEAALLAGVREGGVTLLELGPLSEADARELAGPTLDAATVRALHRDSGGNPFYLEQLLRGVRAGAPAAGPVDAPLPQRVEATIACELSRLSRPVRRLLDAAAVAGERFEPGVAAEIVGTDDEQALAAVDELLARHAGELLGRTGTDDPVDAIVAQSAARRGNMVLTSDPEDMQRLADDLESILVRAI